MQAGNAGPLGAKPAAGGDVRGFSLTSLTGVYGATDLTLLAGNGSNGGAGGRLFFVGYGSTSDQLLPVPTGDIIVKAGDGSALHPAVGPDYAGAGGSILNLYGSVTSGANKMTSITAGHGGAVAGGTKTGAGGSLSNINLQRGPTDNTVPAGVLTLTAGDAGDADGLLGTTATVGANGGSVTGVTVGDIGIRTNFLSVAAGDASPGSVKGGLGGSVLSVQTQNQDIGVRTGVAYGYATMGGIFAGLGGASAKTAGLAGNVELINANSISSIAAGKANTPALANTVAYIKLNAIGVPTAVPPETGTAVTDQIEFTYHPVVVQTNSVPGDPGTAQSQTFERVPGGSAQFVQPAGGPTTFTLTFQGQTTAPLDADAPAGTIQNALNALPAVQAAGDVTVTSPGTFPPSFKVTFNNPGVQTPITGVGSERTAPLVGNATDAQARAAINDSTDPTMPHGLGLINDGAVGNYPGIPEVTVESPAAASYQVSYADPSAAFGEITAEHLITHTATETTVGGPTTSSVQHVELYSVGQFKLQYTSFGNTLTTGLLNVGASPADVTAALQAAGIDATATTSAVNTYDVHFTAAGPVSTLQSVEYASFSAVRQANTDGHVTELVKGTVAMPEQQELKLDPTTRTFTLQFQDTGPSSALPIGASAQQVQDALNLLNSPSAGQVAVAATAAQIAGGTYDITYGVNGAQPLNEVAAHEMTHITNLNFTPLRGVNDVIFTLPGRSETVTVVADKYTSTPVTAAQVNTALNLDPGIMSDGGVKVTLTPDNIFHIAFNTPANAEVIHASEVLPASVINVTPVGTMPAQVTEVVMGDSMATPEVQNVQLDPGTNYFTLKYSDTAATPPQDASTATSTSVQAALHALMSPSVGDVSVTGTVAAGFTITYTGTTPPNSPEPLISVTETTDQVDQLTVSNLGSFHIVNGAATPVELSPNATAAQVAAAINAGMAQPEVSVTMPPGAHGIFLVKYLDGKTHPSMTTTAPGVVDTLALTPSGPQPGAIDNLAYARPQIFDEAIYTQQANLVGAIVDLNHLGSEHFAFLETAAGRTPGTPFQLGDTAIDGLIAAKNLSQKTLNFTPQARLIVNSDANSAPLHFLPVDPLSPTVPVFYDFANDLS